VVSESWVASLGRHLPCREAARSTWQRTLLTEAFRQAFKNKPVLVRHNDAEFMEARFGIYYDTFATLSREPPTRWETQFPWMATHVYPEVWKHAPIEGEVEYNWQKNRPEADPENTFGRTPDETMKVPAYRRYMIDKIRRYHASYLGWISNYNATDSCPSSPAKSTCRQARRTREDLINTDATDERTLDVR